MEVTVRVTCADQICRAMTNAAAADSADASLPRAKQKAAAAAFHAEASGISRGRSRAGT
jgi:hypothetical protein